MAALCSFILSAADADRAVANLAVVLGRLVLRLNAADAGRRHRVEIDRHFQLIRIRGESLRATARRPAHRPRSRRPRPSSAARSESSSRVSHGFELARRARLADTSSHTCCARANCREATRTFAPSRASSRTTRRPTEPVAASTVTVAPASGTCFRAQSTAAAAVVFAPFESSITETRIGPKKHSRALASSFSPAATSAAADEHGRVLQVGRAAREHRAVDEVAHGVGRHAAVPQQLVDARIDRHDRVEHARLRIGVEAEEDFGE